MSEFQAWTSQHRTIRASRDWNALLDHGLEKPASYIIRKNGNYYEAINGSTGKIDFGGANNAGGVSGSDAAAVIQQAINNMSNGQTLFVKHGKYNLNSTVTINKRINLIGESSDRYYGTVFNSQITNGSKVIEVNAGSYGIYNTKYANFAIVGNGAEGDGLYIYLPQRLAIVSNIYIAGVGGNGISIKDGFDIGLEYVRLGSNGGCGGLFDDVNNFAVYRSTINSNDIGIKAQNLTGGFIHGVCDFYDNNKDIYLYNVQSVSIIGNYFEPKIRGIEVTGTSEALSSDILIDGNYFNGVDDTLEYDIVIDYAGSVCYGITNYIADDYSKSIYVTANAGTEWGPIVIWRNTNIGLCESDYVLHIRHYNADFRLWKGEMAVESAGKGVIVKTPDGTTKYRIRVDNAGNVVTEAV